jgi:predicted transposase YbfD/YdcC
VALLGWGSAALKCAPRDRYLGWSERERIERLHLVANNVRFLLLGSSPEKNLASRILSQNLRRLSGDWERAWGHPIYLVETFVDPSRFRGTCYRASNWLLLGETRGWSKQGKDYRHHGVKKLMLVYPLHRRARDLLSRPLAAEKNPKEEERRVMAETLDINALPLAGEGGLFEALQQIVDPRKARGLRHPLIGILSIAACATLAGAKGFDAIAQWAKNVGYEVRLRLGAKRRKPPSEPTVRRVLKAIGVAKFETTVGQWFRQQGDLRGKGVALDGKALRGSADGDGPQKHLVSLVTHDEGLVLSEVPVSDKSNEITAVKPLLEPVEMEGAVVTADAIHTQKETARYIVEEKKADYILIAKENQPTLLDDVKTFWLEDFPPSGEHHRERARADRDASSVDEEGRGRLPGISARRPSISDRADSRGDRQGQGLQPGDGLPTESRA